MPTIAKITNGASAQKAIDYALGKEKPLHNNSEKWLDKNDLHRDEPLKDTRAIAVGGTNGVFGDSAKEQFETTRRIYDQTQKKNQVLRITQSFSKDELNPLNKQDWQKANDLGTELAEKLYPDYQSAVYTHLDGQNHILHNHIIVNKVNLTNGKKMRENKGQTVDRARYFNDQIAREQGWKVIGPKNERDIPAERDLVKKEKYSWVHDLKQRINTVMSDDSINDFKTFSDRLGDSNVIVSERGKNSLTYHFIDADGKKRQIRSTRLGTDYEKRTIQNELENRPELQKQRRNAEFAGIQREITSRRRGMEKPLTAQVRIIGKDVQETGTIADKSLSSIRESNKTIKDTRAEFALTAKKVESATRDSYQAEKRSRELARGVKQRITGVYKSIRGFIEKESARIAQFAKSIDHNQQIKPEHKVARDPGYIDDDRQVTRHRGISR